MPTSLGHAALEAHASMAGLIALCGELVDRNVIDARGAENVRETMVRAVRQLEMPGQPAHDILAAIDKSFAWSTRGQTPPASNP